MEKSVVNFDNKLNNELNRIKFKSFGKVRFNSKNNTPKELEKLYHQKQEAAGKRHKDDEDDQVIKEIDANIVKALHQEQKKKLEIEMRALERLKHSRGNAAKTFKLKADIVGGKKKPPADAVIKIPETNEVIMEPSEI